MSKLKILLIFPFLLGVSSIMNTVFASVATNPAIEVYTDANLGGERYDYWDNNSSTNPAYDISDESIPVELNDNISSIYVYPSHEVMACTDSESEGFGNCMLFGEGVYNDLSNFRMDNSISHLCVRSLSECGFEVAVFDDVRMEGANQIYHTTGIKGPSLHEETYSGAFEIVGNDRISSITVNPRNYMTACDDFTMELCYILTSHYIDLASYFGLNDAISFLCIARYSDLDCIESVPATATPMSVMSSLQTSAAPFQGFSTGEYDETLNGSRKLIDNNDIEGLYIASGYYARICKHNSESQIGPCHILESGLHDWLRPIGWDNIISNICVSEESDDTCRIDYPVQVFDGTNYDGGQQSYGLGEHNLTQGDHILSPDRISSLKIESGYSLTVCIDSSESGACKTYQAGSYSNLDDFDNNISYVCVFTVSDNGNCINHVNIPTAVTLENMNMTHISTSIIIALFATIIGLVSGTFLFIRQP